MKLFIQNPILLAMILLAISSVLRLRQDLTAPAADPNLPDCERSMATYHQAPVSQRQPGGYH